MPGVAGIITKISKEKSEADLEIMIRCMMHEAFYVSRTYTNEEMGIYAGWVGHKGSFSDCMPIWNEKKDCCLLFSGEDFPDPRLKEDLRIRGHRFDFSKSEYLIHLYEEQGDEFLGSLNGQFCGVLIDLVKRKGILFNDRYGMRRIYYYEDNDGFYFSSEAKSILRIKPETRRISTKSLGEFFSFGCVLNNRTLFCDISLLPGSSAWIFRDGRIVVRDHHFKAEIWENQPVLEKEIYYKKLRETFLRVLPRYFSSVEPIGMSLTGGLDTRMIMSCIDIPNGGLPCYTFGGMYRDCRDVKVARKIAKESRQRHEVIRVDERFLSNFAILAERTVYLTDGSMDVSGSPDLFVNMLAREIAPIRVTGNYGSEILRSVRSFKPNPPNEKIFHPDFGPHVREAVKSFEDSIKGHRLSFMVFKQMPWHHYGRLALEQTQLTQRSPFLDYELVRNVYQAPPETTRKDEVSLRLIADGNPLLRKYMTDRGVGGDSHFLFSMIARSCLEFTFKAEYAYDYGMPQWIAKIDHMISCLRPEQLFLGRHKFSHFRVWYRDQLGDYIKDILLDKKTMNRSYLNAPFIESMVRSHIKGNCNFTTEIHKILTSELIQRSLLEGNNA